MTSIDSVIGAGAPDEDEVQRPLVEPAPFTVVGDNIVVELVQREEETVGGIVLVKEREEIPPDVIVAGIGQAAREHFLRTEGVNIGLGTILMTRRSERVRVELADDGRELYVLKPGAVIGTFNAEPQAF